MASPPPADSPRRSVKRRLDPTDSPDNDAGSGGGSGTGCFVEPETEAAALRAALMNSQQTIRDLCAELDEERNASSSAANETMSMILRLQHEKAEALLDARQFRRFAEDRFEHDRNQLMLLEDLLFKRDEALQSLASEIEAYRHRLVSNGIEPPPLFDYGEYDYPPLFCNTEYEENEEVGDLRGIEDRIRDLEGSPSAESSSHEKGVLDEGFEEVAGQCNVEEFPVTVDRLSDEGEEDDRVYTIDAVHEKAVGGGVEQCRVRVFVEKEGVLGEGEEGDIKKLYARLQALEADRESMKQALVSMRTEKAQLVLLKEIAQQLCKEVKPERRVVEKVAYGESFWGFQLFKWIVSILTWRRKASQSKYTFGMSRNNAGLLLLLEKSPPTSHLRCITVKRG